MGRVGLIDITVGNAARLGASTFHHATLRVAPHRYATREPLGTSWRLSRVYASSAQALKRLWLRDGMAFEGDAVQRAADEIEFALRKDDDNAEGASSSHDHPICNDFE